MDKTWSRIAHDPCSLAACARSARGQMGILMRTTPISSTLLLTLVAAMVGNPASGFHFPLPAGTARVGPAVTVCMAGRATRGSRGGARGGQTSWGRRAGETGEGGGGGWRGAQGASGSRGARGARGGRLVADEMPLEGDGRMVPNRGWNDREKVEDMIRMRQGTIEELTVEAMEARLQTKLFGKKKDWKEIQEASKGKLRADRSAARASTRTAAGTVRSCGQPAAGTPPTGHLKRGTELNEFAAGAGSRWGRR